MTHHLIQRIPSSSGFPFSAAVRVGDIWTLSGQIGLDPHTNQLVPNGVGPETRRTLENMKSVLEEAGSSLRSVISVGVFLTDIADFDEMNKVYATFFDAADYPARSTVAVTALALGAKVEIECTAVHGS